MRLVKRILTTFTHTLDGALQQIENHDALIGAAINEASEACARAQTQMLRVQGDQKSLAAKIATLREQADSWQRRAVELGATEQQKAIECLKRRKSVVSELGVLTEQLKQHELATSHLSNDISKLQSEIEKLKQRRNLMRTRQSRADALRVVQSMDGPLATDIHEVMERWEDKVTESEAYTGMCSALSAGQTVKSDALDAELTTAEEQKALQAELASLLANTTATSGA